MEMIFTSEDGFDLIRKPEVLPIVLTGVTHESQEVRELVLGLLQSWGADERKSDVLLSAEAFPALLAGLRDESVAVAETASALLAQLCLRPAGLRILLDHKEELLQAGEPEAGSPLHLLRGLALCIRVGGGSEAGCASLFPSGGGGAAGAWLRCLARPGLRGDPLMLVNFLELGSQLLALPRAFARLHHPSLLEGAVALLPARPTDDVFDAIIRCAVLQFLEAFGAAAQACGWAEWASVPCLLPVLRQHATLAARDLQMQRASLNTIASIGCSPTGLLFIRDLLPLLGEKACTCDEEMKITALNGISAVLASNPEPEVESETGGARDALLEMWQAVGVAASVNRPTKMSSLTYVFSIAKMPMPEQSNAGYRALLGLAHHSWGLQAMRDEAGLLEYLLDRRSEASKAGCELKYSVIERMSLHPKAAAILPEATGQRLLAYLRLGPFGVAHSKGGVTSEAM